MDNQRLHKPIETAPRKEAAIILVICLPSLGVIIHHPSTCEILKPEIRLNIKTDRIDAALRIRAKKRLRCVFYHCRLSC
jgi:hypothetical protein